MRTWWAIIIFSFVLFSLAPSFYELQQSEKLTSSRSFELVHNYYTDYNFYLSRIRQGYDGKWLLHETYTNEPHHGTIIHELYLLLGQASRFIPDVSFAIPSAYHVARAVLGIFLFTLIAWAGAQLFTSGFWQVIAFLLVVTSAGWPLIASLDGGGWRFNNYMPWWTVLEPLQRITFIPHILAAQAGLLFLVMTIPTKKNWIFLGILAMLVGLSMPQALMMVYGIYVLLSTIDNRTSTRWPRVLIMIMSVWTIVYFLPLLSQYPWKRLIDFEVLHPTRFSYFEYLKTLGISLPLGLLGAGIVLWKKDTKWYPIVAWAIGVPLVVLMMLIKPIQHPLRFTEMAAYIPLGLLTAYVFSTCVFLCRKKPYISMFLYAGCFMFILYGITAMYHQYFWQKDFIDQKIIAGWPAIPMNNYIVYPSKGFIDAIAFIDAKTDKNSVVLTEITAGNFIPARTGRLVYVGHENTSYKEEKLVIAKEFYQGNMDPKKAYAWIVKEGITHIFVGPEEKLDMENIDLPTVYPFLRQIYGNTDAAIYSFYTPLR
ncbi:MAG: seg [Microgenomates group bacterium GW2011_GWC1_39_12]|nr:MAG: seg [Microgenomates group bacterium GW2011_GWC1_39_12]